MDKALVDLLDELRAVGDTIPAHKVLALRAATAIEELAAGSYEAVVPRTETRDQIAAVMLRRGTGAQQVQALQYAHGLPIATDAPPAEPTRAAVLQEAGEALGEAWTSDMSYPEALQVLSRLEAVEARRVAWACVKCNSPRSVDPCPKCGTALTKPADGWEWPTLPDIDRIRELAREVGYAVGVHGSLERDLDLIAAPWVADAVGPLELAEHIAAGLGGRVVDYETQDKPCGRWSCNIHTPDWTKMIDLSVAPRLI